jgi:hypothetical protein
MFLEVNASQITIHRRFQMKFGSSFPRATGILIATGALTISTSNAVAESGGAPAIGISAPSSEQDNSAVGPGQDNSTAADLTGTWQVSWTAKSGQQLQVAMQITQRESNLTGSVDWGQASPSPVKGTLNGNQVSLTTKLRRKVNLTGTVNGDKMSGTTDRGVAWSATRQ